MGTIAPHAPHSLLCYTVLRYSNLAKPAYSFRFLEFIPFFLPKKIRALRENDKCFGLRGEGLRRFRGIFRMAECCRNRYEIQFKTFSRIFHFTMLNQWHTHTHSQHAHTDVRACGPRLLNSFQIDYGQIKLGANMCQTYDAIVNGMRARA